MNSITGPVTDSVPLTLACHPQTPCQAIRGVDAVIGAAPGNILTLAFVLECDLSRLRIPEPRSSRRAGGLWAHTCFEVFVMAEDGPGYREFNFSPSGEWAVYAFRSYRDGGELDVDLAPGIVVRRTMNPIGAGCGDLSGFPAAGPSVAAGAVRGHGRCRRRAVLLGVATSSGQARLPSH
jgi:hypothetical protein